MHAQARLVASVLWPLQEGHFRFENGDNIGSRCAHLPCLHRLCLHPRLCHAREAGRLASRVTQPCSAARPHRCSFSDSHSRVLHQVKRQQQPPHASCTCCRQDSQPDGRGHLWQGARVLGPQAQGDGGRKSDTQRAKIPRRGHDRGAPLVINMAHSCCSTATLLPVLAGSSPTLLSRWK
jgi:hypothetical protein